ncbi:MAG: endo-1,4-beta-xylanase [Oscillospiraceae bacterium]|nr:endo-1,4-beta-xylanase [Oscillospiraceae bacterium]
MGPVSLKERYKGIFDVGAAVWPGAPGTHGELIKRHFSCLTCENVMKPTLLQPERGRYAFSAADKLVEFAAQNGMKMRGHTLVWHNQTPSWFFQSPGGGEASREELLSTLEEHTRTVMGRYKGRVYCWDVVNEALADSSGGFLRGSPYLRIIGEDYIDRAFHIAHEADPDALLFYNEYNECDSEKRERLYTLVKELRERDVPVHGIGMQMHSYLESPSAGDIRAAIERYASLGVVLHVTELEISVYEWDDRRTDLKAPSPQMLERQAERYGELFALFREYKDVVTCVTTWGVADDYTWLDDFPQKGRKNWPLLFDMNHQPKAAFDRVTEF